MELEWNITSASAIARWTNYGRKSAACLWLACSYCNDAKNNRVVVLDPESGELVSLFNPRQQIWKEHFAWTEQGDTLIGLTPIGRATIVALSLNHRILVNARKLWVSWGIHPPKD